MKRVDIRKYTGFLLIELLLALSFFALATFIIIRCTAHAYLQKSEIEHQMRAMHTINSWLEQLGNRSGYTYKGAQTISGMELAWVISKQPIPDYYRVKASITWQGPLHIERSITMQTGFINRIKPMGLT